jgi:hypothetical protein
MKDSFIVSSHFQEDVRWLENYTLPVVLVSKDGGNYGTLNHDLYYNVHRAPNKLRESGAYLWFIINYWNNLPDKMFFIHGHEISHHQKLPINQAIKKYIDSDYQDFNHCKTLKSIINEEQQLFIDLWKSLYSHRLGTVPKEINFQYGCQFVVDRSLIKMHPLNFYRRTYDLSCVYAESHDLDYKMGTFFEATWHLIFDQQRSIK